MSGTPEAPFAWRLGLALLPVGLLFAALTIGGALPGVRVTQLTALGLLALVGVVVGLRAPGRPFRHGLFAGFLVGLAAIWTQAVFLGTYFANNAEYADVPIPFGLPPRLATFVLGPINAVLAGVIAGVVAWACWAVVRARPGSRSPSE